MLDFVKLFACRFLPSRCCLLQALLCSLLILVTTDYSSALPSDLKLTITAEGQTQTLHLHKRTARTSDFQLLTWDSTNGYVVANPTPEVRTYRGTIAENPNAIVLASIDANNMLRALCIDRVHNHNMRWRVETNVSSQLTSPATPVAMPSQAVADPRSGSTGTPKVGPKVPTGTSPSGVPYGKIVEYELGMDLTVAAYNRYGQNIDNVLAVYELDALIFEQFMLRDVLVRMVFPTIVIRKGNFYAADPGSMSLGAIGTEWNKQPLVSKRWDNVWGSEGAHASGGIGRAAGGAAAGALYHENTHNWGAYHLAYHCDTMGGNMPSLGPMIVERVSASRKAAIDRGELTLATAYTDPIPPYTHTDVARTTMGTAIDIDVLANDHDANGDVLSISAFNTSTVPGGAVTLNANGTLRYVPPAGYVGKDMIVYTAKDSSTMELKTREIVHIEVVNNGLIAHYKFNETTGTTASNAVSNAPPAELNGGAFSADSVPSPLGRGVRANGLQNDDHIENGNWSGIILGTNYVMPITLGSLYPSGTNGVNRQTPFETEYNRYSAGYDILDGNYTFSTWFRCDDFSNYSYVAAKWWHPETSVGWDMGVFDKKLTLHWRIFQGEQGIQQLVAPAFNFVPGRWYHAGAVFDRATGETKLYLNGTKVATKASAFPANGVIFNGRAPLCMGVFAQQKYCFDDARIYSKALTDAEFAILYAEPGATIKALDTMSVTGFIGLPLAQKTLQPFVWAPGNGNLTFSLQSGPSWLSVSPNGFLNGTPEAAGSQVAVVRVADPNNNYADITINLTVADPQLNANLLAHWGFDEGSGATVNDLSGNGKAATLSGATRGALNGGGYSLVTDGSDTQYAQAPALSTPNGFTLMAWIKPSSNRRDTMISQRDSYAFKVSGSGLVLTTPGRADHYSGDVGIVADRWQHVAVSFKPSVTGGVNFYVNGVLKSTVNASSLGQNSNPTILGRSLNWSGSGYSGQMDDVRVYGKAFEDPGIIGGVYGTFPNPPESVVKREVWNSISGVNLSDLTSSPDYPASPDVTEYLASLEYTAQIGAHGARISSWFTPATSGTWYFYVAADDASELWLSTNSDPANKVKIAGNSAWTGYQQWTKYATQKSAAISLIAGRSYYLEGITKAGGGGDNFAVGWQPSAGGAITTLPATQLRVTNPNAAPVAVNDSPSVNEGTFVTIPVLANDIDANAGPSALSITSAGTPLHGTVSVIGGSIRYTPEVGYYGQDSFSYTISDGDLFSSATVNITVIDTSTAHDLTGAGLVRTNIGGVSGTSRVLAGGDWEIVSNGTGGGASDVGAFESSALSGHFEVVVRLEDLTGPPGARSGLMIREGTGNGSRFVSVGITGAGEFYYANRTTTGGSAVETVMSSPVPSSPDAWVLLRRAGEKVHIAISEDGIDFQTVSVITVSGLAAQLETGVFTTGGTSSSARAVISGFDIPFVLPSSAFAWWELDENTGTIAYDAFAARNMALVNNPTWAANAGSYGLSFDGTNDYLSIGGSAVSGNWSVATWVKRTGTKASASLLGSSAAALKLEQWNNTHKVGLTRYGVADYSFNYIAPLDTWVHLTFTGTATETKLYVNGLLTGTLPVGISLPMQNVGCKTSGVDHMQAELDSLILFNSALSDTEVLSVYQEMQ